jgi:hypothetical protein
MLQMRKIEHREVSYLRVYTTLDSGERDGYPFPGRSFLGCRLSSDLCFLRVVRKMDLSNSSRSAVCD